MPVEGPLCSVTAEMERIFQPLDGRVYDRTAPAKPPRARWWRGPGRRLLLLGAPALVLPAAAALMVVKDRVGTLPVREQVSRLTPARPAPERLITVPQVANVPTAADPRSLHVDAIGEATRHPPVVTPEAPSDAILAEAGSQPSRRLRNAPPELSRSPRVAIVSASGWTGQSGCDAGSRYDACVFEEVMDADAHLRRAYREADRAGVPSWRLASIAERWRAARGDADVDPEGTIRRYDRLADTLDDLRDDER